MAAKLKGVIHRQQVERAMLIEGLLAIAEGENPRNIEARLSGAELGLLRDAARN